MTNTSLYLSKMTSREHGKLYSRVRWYLLKIATVATGHVDALGIGRLRTPRSLNPYDYLALRRGRYEMAETQILDEEFRPDDLIIEIGSNIGYMSRRVSQKLSPRGVLVCVEADPKMIPYLESNLEECQRAHKVHIVAAAVGSPTASGRGIFRQRRDLCSGLAEVSAANGSGTGIEIPVRSLSSIVDMYDTQRAGYSLVCDAEGAEILMLKEDSEAFARCRQIAIELHGPAQTGLEITPDDIIAMFRDLGFIHKRAIGDAHYFHREKFVP